MRTHTNTIFEFITAQEMRIDVVDLDNYDKEIPRSILYGMHYGIVLAPGDTLRLVRVRQIPDSQQSSS